MQILWVICCGVVEKIEREGWKEGGSGHATMTTNFKVGSLQENFIFIPC